MAILVLFALIGAGCGVGDATESDGSDGSSTKAETTTTNPGADPTLTTQRQGPEDEIVREATLDLAGRLDIPEEEIEVVEVNSVEWPDASLGCPEKGRIYAQVITPGLEVILSAEGSDYHYHSGPDQEPFLCIQPSNGKLIPPRGPVDIPDSED